MSTTAKSNPFQDINGLVDALEKAPQDKEGAFRVATWLMVLKEIQRISNQVGQTAEVINNQETPTVEEIKQQVKEENTRIGFSSLKKMAITKEQIDILKRIEHETISTVRDAWIDYFLELTKRSKCKSD